MKRISKSALLMILIMFLLSNSYSQQIQQWKNYSAFFRIKCMLDLDTAVLAGTDFNGLVSINKGGNQVYYINNTNSDFRGNNINSLARDDSGKIWVASFCGLSCFSNGIWNLFTSQNSILPNCGISALYFSRNAHALYVGTEAGNVIRIDSSGWAFIIGQNGSPSGFINSIVTDTNGYIWAGTKFTGIYKYDGTNWIWYNSSNSPINNFVSSMTIDSLGNVWAATTFKLHKFNGTSWSSYIEPGFGMVKYICADTNNNIWCSSESGVRTFNGNTWNYLPFNIQLTSHNINCHLWDKSYFWTGMENDGVDHITINTSNVSNFPLKPTLPYPLINSIDFDINGNKTWFAIPTIWGGWYDGIVCNFDGITWQQYHANNSTLLSNNIKTICTDINNSAWVATRDTGLYLIQGNSISHFNKINSDLYNDDITSLGKDAGSGLLIGFADGTVQTLQNNIFQTIIQGNQVNSAINKILNDDNGAIWLATESSGLLKYFNSNIIVYNTSNVALLSNHINDIKFDTLHHLWIATDAGIIYYDGNNTWTSFTTLNSGIPDNNISALTIGSDNSLWVGSKFDGLAHYESNTWTTYKECISQLAGNNIYDMKTSAGGDIYIATNRGVNILKIDYITGRVDISEPMHISVFPNPGKDYISFGFESYPNTKFIFMIYNTLGQSLLRKEVISDSNGKISVAWDLLDPSQLIKSGVYYYTFVANDKTVSGKIIVVR